MPTKIPFIKTYSTQRKLVHLPKERGMEITDEGKAEHYLAHIGYYRLSAYTYPLLSILKEQHMFKQGTTFSKVMMLYRFDKKLRLLLLSLCLAICRHYGSTLPQSTAVTMPVVSAMLLSGIISCAISISLQGLGRNL